MKPAQPSPVQTVQVERLIKARDAGRYLGLSPSTVNRMARARRLPSIAIPVGNSTKVSYRFRISDLNAYIDGISIVPE
jgi:excisionase family DNA binding protein